MAQTRPRTVPPRAASPAAGPALTTGWAAAILAVLTVLFFHELVLGGRTFVSPDTTAPLGFVRVGEQSLWQDRVYPLWNPFVFLGMPSFGSGAYNPLIYPPDWPLALIARVIPLPDMTWMLIYYFLGGFFLFLLAREWGARAEAALLAAAAFVYQPNLIAIGSHGHGSQLVNSAYLPLMVWLAWRWLDRGQVAALGALALAGGFQLLRGHVQVCFYTWMAIGILAAVHSLGRLREPGALPRIAARLAGAALAAGLAFGVAGFFNLPLRDYAHHSIRSGGEGGGTGLAYATGWSMAPYELPAALFPNWVGFGNPTYWGAMPFTDYPNAFLGVVAVLLMVLAAAVRGMPGLPRVFAVAVGGVSLLVAFGSHFPLYQWLYDHLPLFNRFRIPVMILVLFQLAAALGVAWGWTAVLAHAGAARRPGAALERVLFVLMAALGLGLLMGLGGGEGLRAWYLELVTTLKPGFAPQAAEAAFAAFAGDLPRVGLIGLLAAGLALLTARGKVPALAASAGMLVLLLVDLWPVSHRVMAPTIGEVAVRDPDFGRDETIRFLQQQGPHWTFRVLDPERFTDNRFAGFHLASLNGYHAAKPRLFQDLVDANASFDTRWLALLNVRFLLLSQPMSGLPPFLQPVHQGPGFVYENLLALPRATVVGEWGLVPDTGRVAIDSVRASGRDPGRHTWLTRDPGVPSAPLDSARAEITRYALHEVVVQVETSRPALLRLAELWYPDWTVTVGGRPAEMLRADHALRAVAVPAGASEVVFRFESRAVRDGMTLSLVSAVLALALLGYGLWHERRRPPQAEA
jgi:hypothetical protein